MGGTKLWTTFTENVLLCTSANYLKNIFYRQIFGTCYRTQPDFRPNSIQLLPGENIRGPFSFAPFWKKNLNNESFCISVSSLLYLQHANCKGKNPTGLHPTGLHPRDCTHGIAPTGLYPHRIAPTRNWTHGIEPTGLDPHGLAPARNWANTGLHPHGIVPTCNCTQMSKII